MTLKILPLEWWQQREITRQEEHLQSIEPKFNRDGQYFNTETKECWFEVDGEAFIASASQFKFNLSVLNHRPMLAKEREAVKILIQGKLASRPLRDLLYLDDYCIDHRKMVFNARKFRNRVLKKMRDKNDKII